MSKRQVLMLIGVWVMVLFYGLPTSVREVLAVLTGLLIIGLAYSFKPEAGKMRPQAPKPYVESRRYAHPQTDRVPPVMDAKEASVGKAPEPQDPPIPTENVAQPVGGIQPVNRDSQDQP